MPETLKIATVVISPEEWTPLIDQLLYVLLDQQKEFEKPLLCQYT